MSHKKDIKELLLIKVLKPSCIESSVILATVSESVVTTMAATPSPTERLDRNSFIQLYKWSFYKCH